MQQLERQQLSNRMLTPRPISHIERFVFNSLHVQVKNIGPDYYLSKEKEDFDAFVTVMAWPFAYALIQLLRIPARRNDPHKGIFNAGAALRSDTKTSMIAGALGITVPNFSKIRTMYVGAHLDEEKFTQGRALVEAKRTRKDNRKTVYGDWLRRTSLDEIAQVMDIKNQEISWVGWRLPSKSDWQVIFAFQEDQVFRRWIQHAQKGWKAGVTGPHGVVDRLMPLAERIQYEGELADGANIIADWRYLALTPNAVLTRRGAV